MTPYKHQVMLRAALVAAATIVATAAGGLLGRIPAQSAEALVGGAMVAMGALLGGAVGLLLGILAASKLPGNGVRLAAGALCVPAALLLLFVALRLWQMDQRTRDPDDAQSGGQRAVMRLAASRAAALLALRSTDMPQLTLAVQTARVDLDRPIGKRTP